jgi:hypothetical protein
MAEILALSHTHTDIARFLLQNPTLPLSSVARHFDYTQSWLSSIIHSSAFQAHLAELQAGADSLVIADVPQRLRGLASAAIDKLSEQLEFAEGTGPVSRVDRQFVQDTAELALKALGFGRPSPVGDLQPAMPGTVIYADKLVIEQARERILDRGRTIEHNQSARPALELKEPDDQTQLQASA